MSCAFKPKGMSYTEFLRSKKSTAIKVINTKKLQDASDVTTQRRLGSSRVFALNNAQTKGVISHPIDFSQEPSHQTKSSYKAGGGSRKVGSASDFTAYAGGQAIGKEIQAGLPAARITQTPAINITSPAVPQKASDFVRKYEGCKQALGQPHNASTVTPPVFVDDTIRNLVRDPSVCVPHNVNQKGCNNFRGANHGIKAETAFPHVPNRPSQAGGQLGIFGNLEPGKEAAAYGGVTIAHVKSNIPVVSIRTTAGVNAQYKVGAARAHIRTVPEHHGNDLKVDPRRVPTKYVNVARQPPQHKINLPVTSI
jgi:hypothetical protein